MNAKQNNNIRQLISEGKIETSLEILLSYSANTEFHNDAIILSNNYKKLQSHVVRGVLSTDDIRKEENRICSLALELASRKNTETSSYSVRNTAKIQLIIEGHIIDFNNTQRDKLIKILATMLDAEEKDIKILNVLSGSIKIVLDLPIDKKDMLINLFTTNSSKLNILKKEFQILNISENIKAKHLSKHIIKYGIDKQPLFTILTIYDDFLNTTNASNLKLVLKNLADNEVKNLIMDITKVKDIDSSGLAAILTGNRLWENIGHFILTGVMHDTIKKLMEISKLTSIIKIIENIDKGIKYITYENYEAEIENS